MYYLHEILMVVLNGVRHPLAVRIDIHPWQTVTVVSQALFVNSLLGIISLPDPDNSVLRRVAGSTK